MLAIHCTEIVSNSFGFNFLFVKRLGDEYTIHASTPQYQTKHKEGDVHIKRWSQTVTDGPGKHTTPYSGSQSPEKLKRKAGTTGEGM